MANESIKILVAQPSHRQGILKLAETALVPYEPVSAASEVKWTEQVKENWEEIIDKALEKPVSHIALNGENEVIGFRLSRILQMEKLNPGDSIYEFIPDGYMRMTADQVTKNWSSILPRTGQVLQFVVLCVHPAYAGRGIAVDMTKENLKLGKEIGCTVATVIASNWMSQRVFEKTGFDQVGAVYHVDFKDESGNQMLRMKDPKQDSVKFYVKNLN